MIVREIIWEKLNCLALELLEVLMVKKRLIYFITALATIILQVLFILMSPKLKPRKNFGLLKLILNQTIISLPKYFTVQKMALKYR